MKLHNGKTGHVELIDPDDCTSFPIVGHRPTAASALDTVAALGVAVSADDPHGFVDPRVLERLAGEQVEDGWSERFERMLRYAISR